MVAIYAGIEQEVATLQKKCRELGKERGIKFIRRRIGGGITAYASDGWKKRFHGWKEIYNWLTDGGFEEWAKEHPLPNREGHE